MSRNYDIEEQWLNDDELAVLQKIRKKRRRPNARP